MIYENIYDLVGKTPVVKFKNLHKDRADIYAKLEFYNPAGSVKDRIAKSMIFNLLKENTLKSTDTIVEPTSGNTGVGLAMICASLGMKAVFTMPETMSIERRKLLLAYGAEIILTDGKSGMSGAIAKAKELVAEKGFIMLSQFENQYNPLAHAQTTAQEIIADFDSLDAFVAGIGTGGTITGNAKALKEHFANIEIIGVEPASSPMITKGEKGPHVIQGIGAGFIPDILDLSHITEVKTVINEDAFAYARKSGLSEGILLGISGGAAYKVAEEMAMKLGYGKKVLFIAPDNGERYLSTALYEDKK